MTIQPTKRISVDPLERAIAIAGGVSRLAELLGCNQPVISNWRLRGVPAARCGAIERATNGMVTRAELRPEIFA